MVRDSDSGRQLLLPPADCCPVSAYLDHAQAWDLMMAPIFLIIMILVRHQRDEGGWRMEG